MRRLKIVATNTDRCYLGDVPEEYKFIELISKRYATSDEEMKKYYAVGVEAALKFKVVVTENTYHSKVAWIVAQAIKSEKIGR